MTTTVLRSTGPLASSAADLDERGRVAWLHRRAGFGLHTAQLEVAAGRGATAELAALTTMADPAPDPFAGFDAGDINNERTKAPAAVAQWIDHLVSSAAPGQDRLTWLLHGWLVSSGEKVRSLKLMTEQISLLATGTTTTYPDLLSTIATNAAMLWYLDGQDSTAEQPNENFSRELLELFGLGVGNYSEDDVAAGARALTGWTMRRRTGEVRFVSRRHDKTPQTYLGRQGVSDVQSVVEAVAGHRAHAPFVARRIAKEYLGQVDDATLAELAEVYVDEGMRLAPVIGRALALGLEGRGSALVLAPIPWLAIARRVTGVSTSMPPRKTIGAAGQVPLRPPNVAGWPSGRAWLSTSATVGRARMAAKLAADTAPDQPVMVAAASGDVESLRLALGIPQPFAPSTVAGLRAAKNGVQRLAMALVSPEFVLS